MDARMLDLDIDNIEQKTGKFLHQKSKIKQRGKDSSIFANLLIPSFLKLIRSNNLNAKNKQIFQNNVNSIPYHSVFSDYIITTKNTENQKDISQISTKSENSKSIKPKNEISSINYKNYLEAVPLEVQDLISNNISENPSITFQGSIRNIAKLTSEKNELENQILNHLCSKIVNNGFENEKSEAIRNEEYKIPKTLKKDKQQIINIFRDIQPKSKNNFEYLEIINYNQKKIEGNKNKTDEHIVPTQKNLNEENHTPLTYVANKPITDKKEQSPSLLFFLHTPKNHNEINFRKQTSENEKGFYKKNIPITRISNAEKNTVVNLKINNQPEIENTFNEMKKFFPLNQPKNVDLSSIDNQNLKIHQVNKFHFTSVEENNNQIEHLSSNSFVNNNTLPKTRSFENLNSKTNSTQNYLLKNEFQTNEKNLVTPKSLDTNNILININPNEKINPETNNSTETYQFGKQNIFEQKDKSKHRFVEKSTNYSPNESKIFDIEQQKVSTTNQTKSQINIQNEPVKETSRPLISLQLTRNSELPSKIASFVNSSTNFPLKAEITLSPISLGIVIVEINVTKNEVEIMFRTETKEAQHILESQIGFLKEKLSNLGFEKQNFEFQNQAYEKSFLNNYNNSNTERFNDDFARREFLRSFNSLKKEKENNFENIWREYDFQHQFS